jgi:hypothetical protein
MGRYTFHGFYVFNSVMIGGNLLEMEIIPIETNKIICIGINNLLCMLIS